MTDKTQAQRLAEPFDDALLGDDGSGHTIVPVAEVVGRLNAVLGVSGWSYEVLDLRRDDLEREWWVAHVRLAATVDGERIVRDGVGGADTMRARKEPNTALAVDNDVKSAVSSALKKAAWHMGVGTYLSRKDSAIGHDAQRTPLQVASPEQLAELERLLALPNINRDECTAEILRRADAESLDNISTRDADGAISWLRQAEAA